MRTRAWGGVLRRGKGDERAWQGKRVGTARRRTSVVGVAHRRGRGDEQAHQGWRAGVARQHTSAERRRPKRRGRQGVPAGLHSSARGRRCTPWAAHAAGQRAQRGRGDAVVATHGRGDACDGVGAAWQGAARAVLVARQGQRSRGDTRSDQGWCEGAAGQCGPSKGAPRARLIALETKWCNYLTALEKIELHA